MKEYSKEVQESAQRFIDREILANQSALVESLLNNNLFEDEGFSYDTIDNIYYTDDELSDHGYDDIQECRDNGEDLKEIYEWYLISDWLKDQLNKTGECVLCTDFGNYWGRTVTGQAIMLDGTLQKLAINLNNSINKDT